MHVLLTLKLNVGLTQLQDDPTLVSPEALQAFLGTKLQDALTQMVKMPDGSTQILAASILSGVSLPGTATPLQKAQTILTTAGELAIEEAPTIRGLLICPATSDGEPVVWHVFPYRSSEEQNLVTQMRLFQIIADYLNRSAGMFYRWYQQFEQKFVTIKEQAVQAALAAKHQTPNPSK